MAATRGRHLAHLPRIGPVVVNISKVVELHPCRILANLRTSLLRFVGLSDNWVFRRNFPLRLASGFHVSGGPFASEGIGVPELALAAITTHDFPVSLARRG